MTAEAGRVARVVLLTGEQEAALSGVFYDAIEYRRPETDDCPDCAASLGNDPLGIDDMCEDHAADQRRADLYAALQRALGVPDPA